MTIQQIAERILNDERIGQRVREIIQEELSADDSNVVYLTATGRQYHSEVCSNNSWVQKKEDWYKEVSLSAAVEVGYTPCSFCH